MKKLVWAASALLCAMICIRPSLTAAASAGDRYDYSRAGDAGAVKVTAADVLARYLESPLDAIEQEFLSHGDFFLTYSAGISSSYVTANFDGARHLTLEAAPYSYEAVNGRTVVWRPVSAEGGGSVQGEKLFYERTDVSPEDGDTVRVTYAAEVEIEAEALNSMLNAAYIAGMGASEKLEEEDARYQAAHKEYLEKKAEFDAYPEKLRQYEEAVAAYEAYRQSYSVWERKKADYDDYLVDRAR